MWLYLTIVAYFINALVSIIDKYLLAGQIPKYRAYAFGVSILSAGAVFLIPFGVYWPGWGYLSVMLPAGALFFVGLLFLYKAIGESDISIAATQTGAIGAITTYFFSAAILGDPFSSPNLLALISLVCGIFLLGKVERRILISSIFAGISFGIYYVLLKFSFNFTGFVNGLFWTRIGFVGMALISLGFRHAREETVLTFKKSSWKSKLLFVFNKFLAGIGFIVLYFAISLGDVSLINGLLGIQFLLTFVLALVLGGAIPSIREKTDRKSIIHKLAGIALVMVGLVIIYESQ